MTTTLSQISQAVFAAGIEAVGKVTVLLLLAWMASAALRRASAALRHLLAAMAIFLVLLMPWLMKLGPQWSIPILPVESDAQGAAAMERDAVRFDVRPIATQN